MTDTTVLSSDSHRAPAPAPVHRAVHAARIPKPSACGCGLPVAFDVSKREFFCIGCGAAAQCMCRRSAWTSTVRPVNVA